MNDLIGKTLANRYRVDAFIGRGGMADVYKVWDQRRTAYLAMKALHEDLAEDNVFLRRFKREAQTLSHLQHPNIVRFYGLEEDNDLAFLLMDFIEGSTLRKEIHRLKGQPFPEQRILEIIRPVCSALHYAHQSGFVHCDVKPANIMIHTNGTVLISDFGIARMTESASTMTMVGAGTPAYMAPEQARGENPTHQTDIYALGVVLFEMLTGGERPFTGENARTTGSTSEKIRWEQMKLEPPSPRDYNPAISPQLEEIVFRCLDKKNAARYSNTLELIVALDAVINVPKVKPNQQISQSVTYSEPSRSKEPLSQVAEQLGREQHHPSPPKNSHWRRWMVACSISLVCITGFCIFSSILIYSSQQIKIQATNSAQARMTSTSAALATVSGMRTQIAAMKATDTAEASSMAEANATNAAKDLLGPYPEWRLLLSNSFEERRYTWDTGDVTNEFYSGNEVINDGKFVWTVKESKQDFISRAWSNNNWNFTDFYMSVDAQEVSGPPTDCYGLNFRDDGNQNYYVFEVCGNQYHVNSHSTDWKTLLGPKVANVITPGQINKLAIAGRGNHFELYINNQLVDTFDDNQYVSGYIGVAIEANVGDTPTFEFNNFVVAQP